MGRRTVRLRRAQLTAQGLSPWIGREVDAILTDGTTRHGRLVAAEASALILEDNLHGLEWADGRHRHRLPYDQIDEVLASPYSPL
jgi:hypothetical protein